MNTQEKTIEKYAFYFQGIMGGFGVDTIDPESLINMALIYPEGKKIVSDEFEEMMIAQKTVKAIQDGKNPFLKYDSDTNMIYRLKMQRG